MALNEIFLIVFIRQKNNEAHLSVQPTERPNLKFTNNLSIIASGELTKCVHVDVIRNKSD